MQLTTTAPKMQNAETINSHQHFRNRHNLCDKFANISLLLSLGKYHNRLGMFADNSLIVCAASKARGYLDLT